MFSHIKGKNKKQNIKRCTSTALYIDKSDYLFNCSLIKSPTVFAAGVSS